MLYTSLGRTDVRVSKICLGTMTWGQQNIMDEAHQQLDYALEAGINFIDTAEMYPVPVRPNTSGSTETYIGHWIAARKNRDKFILASKAAGPGPQHIRQGPKFNREHLTQALENSLRRLQTEYIDLYQLHWPERKTNFFGRLGYVHREDDLWQDNLLEILEILNDFIKEGKIRYIGISNETPWATMRYLALADKHNLPRMISIQNPYSLLNRTFEVGLAEITIREKISLLAYSPLAFGLLSGKYFNGSPVENARLTLFPELPRYNGELSRTVARKYVDLAHKNNISPTQMALAYVNSRPFLTCNIIGATSMEQLKEDIESIDINLSEELIKEIETIHQLNPNPAP